MQVRDPVTGQLRFSKRRRRYDEDRLPRELTFSCFRRFRFLERDRTRQWFIDALQEARQRWPIAVWAWVIMPEHVHLLVAPRQSGVKVGKFAGYVKEHTARPAIKWLKEHAPEFLPSIAVQEGAVTRRRFWQPGGGYDRNILKDRTLIAAIEYIHANPVRRGLCERPEDWEWSSARWHAGMRPAWIEMDPSLPMMHE